MKKEKKIRIASIVISFLLILQLLPSQYASAAGANLTGTKYLSVHGTIYDPPTQESSLKLTEADGTTPINPDSDGNYSNVPSGAKIVLNYAFSLADGEGTELYTYHAGDYFSATLPNGINFAATSGAINATDSTSGSTYSLATWTISGNTLIVSLTSDGADASHLSKWGLVNISGTFKPLNAGDNTDEIITFGSQTITIHRQPLPNKSTLSKTGTYDASANAITWNVTVTPPSAYSGTAYDGYSVIDTFSSNQTYVPGSFTVGGTAMDDSKLSIDSASRTISYTFPDTDPDTTGTQYISYQTSPSTFSAESGPSSKLSTYSNTVDLKRGSDIAADEATSSVSLDWISKTGKMVDTSASDPTVVLWTVSVTVPGDSGKAISGAKIIDTIPSTLDLLQDAGHPVSVAFGAGAAATVSNGTSDGEYTYSGNVLTYTFPSANQPASGTTAKLTFYTHVAAGSWSSYLGNNNSISFSNSAQLSWNENSTATYPSDSYTISSGIPGGGLLSKTAGSATNYQYSSSDPGTIHWTITVNRNKIDIKDAEIDDNIFTNQNLLIDTSHPFTVVQQDSATPQFSTDTALSTGNFTCTASSFIYKFPEETSGSGTISSKYTIDYYTQIIDPTGLKDLYSNGTINTFTNGVTLKGSGILVYTNPAKSYYSHMLEKSIVKAYDYNTRTIQWQTVINRNGLPLTNAIMQDTLPSGMALFIDSSHPVTITDDSLSGGDTGTLTATNGDSSFSLTLPSSTLDQYTVTYWSVMSEDTLKTQWDNTKNFTNSASLTAKEIASKITATATASIKNPVVSKTYQYTTGNDTIDWSVVINPAQVTLHNAVVNDSLNSSLKLDPSSIALYSVAVDSSSGNAAATGTAVDPSTYTVTLPSSANGNKLSVALPAETNLAYRLNFSTSILSNSIDLTNTVNISGTATDTSGSATSKQIVVTDLYSNGGSGSNTLTVHKTDSSGNPLSGATFTLLNVNQQPITKSGSRITATTDASGNAVFSNLPSWIFYVQETDPTTGYLIPSNPIFGGSRLSGSDYITVSNELALTNVSFSKIGAGGAPLSGGTFTLTGFDYALHAVSKTAAAVNGVVTFSGIAPNQTGVPYIIKETTAPKGHELNSSQLSATVTYNTDKNALVVTVTPDSLFNTPIKGSVSFSKTGTGGVMLSGGAFTLSGTDYSGNSVNMPGKTAVNGTVTFTDVPIGNYTITETIPPDGYLMPSSAAILSAAVTYNSDYSGVETTIKGTASGAPVVTSYSDEQALGTLSFSKLDKNDNKMLSGGTFTLSGKDFAGNNVSINASSVGGTVTFSGVPLGDNYSICETAAPSGYQISNSIITASVKYNPNKTSVVTSISDTAMYDQLIPFTITADVNVLKTEKGGNKLSGAQFTLYNTSGNAIATAVTGPDGLAQFNHLSIGSYIIKETKSPTGYQLNTDPINFSVSNSSSQTFTVIDDKLPPQTGSIAILKTDEDGNVLAGAEFTLYDLNGKAVTSGTTKPDGTLLFNAIPIGQYTLKETSAPIGYIISSTDENVTITSGATLSFTFTNKKGQGSPTGRDGGKLRLAKVDENRRPLAGAEFTLYDSNGNTIGKAISGSDGIAEFSNLALGEYSVKETSAPDGYILFTESLKFQIKTSDSTLSFTLKDTPVSDDSGVAGWSDSNTPNGSQPERLPQTGGIPATFYMLLAGISLLLGGLFAVRHKKKHSKDSSK